MSRFRDRVTGLILCLSGFVLAIVTADAQELLWYRTPLTYQSFDTVASVMNLRGVPGGFLVGGKIAVEFRHDGHFLQHRAPDGEEIWHCDLPAGFRSDYNTGYVDTSMVAPHPDGGWWFVAQYLESTGPARPAAFVRYHISSEGSILSSKEMAGKGKLVTSDGIIIDEQIFVSSIHYGENLIWRFLDPDTRQTDSIVIDMAPIVASFEGSPSLTWRATLEDRAYILLSNGLLGECALVTVDFSTGTTKTVHFDDVPTKGLSGVVMKDKSVVILARESRWREGSADDLVLIRPDADGGETERFPLPIRTRLVDRVLGVGEMSTGDLVFRINGQNDGTTVYRTSPDGSTVSFLRIMDVADWAIHLAPDDALYAERGYYFGRIVDPEPTSSVSDDGRSGSAWGELDLSGVE